ncbi:hypothetical protein NDU88_003833 [Pleurodeles waltl]|uniref:Uncharacterized protein n=1 Tax=Pleurodeles waltl TaxID=8319 RepID=A0AAV7MT17_PLEWA|nr:hypothetical protein NDU88_003833 [Pleurodeles waltl]
MKGKADNSCKVCYLGGSSSASSREQPPDASYSCGFSVISSPAAPPWAPRGPALLTSTCIVVAAARGHDAGASSADHPARTSDPGRPRHHYRFGPGTASALSQTADPPPQLGHPPPIRRATPRRNCLPLASGCGPRPQRPRSSGRASRASPRASRARRYPAVPRFNPMSGRGPQSPAHDPR